MAKNAQRRSSPEYTTRFEKHVADAKGIKMVAVDVTGKILGYKMNGPDPDGEWRGGGTYILILNISDKVLGMLCLSNLLNV
ncbi:MAG: hypothetical protein LBF37_04060 [Rickettsiales bacterium]|jgi:hypothetical protein|nr:hypothetical protein [Rickettsiales bacterium]